MFMEDHETDSETDTDTDTDDDMQGFGLAIPLISRLF